MKPTNTHSKGPNPKWRNTAASGMRAYIAFQIVMGVISVPNQDMYFLKDNLIQSVGITELIYKGQARLFLMSPKSPSLSQQTCPCSVIY